MEKINGVKEINTLQSGAMKNNNTKCHMSMVINDMNGCIED